MRKPIPPAPETEEPGVIATPTWMARRMVRGALTRFLQGRAALPPDFRLLDLGCGAGVFVAAAARELRARGLAGIGALHGVDHDEGRLAIARAALSRLTAADQPRVDWNKRLARVDALADALVDDSNPTENQDVGSILAPASFDVVVSNPPYVNIRRLARTVGPERVAAWRRQYRCAFRGYDLFVLFVERALRLLRAGGVGAFIVPNKLAALGYARPCREMLLRETTLLAIEDWSGVPVFAGARVYPHVLWFRKAPPPPDHACPTRTILARGPAAGGPQVTRFRRSSFVQSACNAADGFPLRGDWEVERRVPTAPLATRAALHAGAAGFTAQRLADGLVEADAWSRAEPAFRFVVSGNIDRYVCRPGPVRFCRRGFRQPLLSTQSPLLTETKRRLFAGSKLILAGMSLRLEAALDEGGLALGVQVYAAADCRDNPYYLLGLLNSKLLSYLFRQRFAAKQLRAGYLAINKGQLERLPIRLLEGASEEDQRIATRVAQLAQTLRALRGGAAFKTRGGAAPAVAGGTSRVCDDSAVCDDTVAGEQEFERYDNELDQCVYALYRLRGKEIRQVEENARAYTKRL